MVILRELIMRKSELALDHNLNPKLNLPKTDKIKANQAILKQIVKEHITKLRLGVLSEATTGSYDMIEERK